MKAFCLFLTLVITLSKPLSKDFEKKFVSVTEKSSYQHTNKLLKYLPNIDEYEFLDVLGSGSLGIFLKASNKGNEFVLRFMFVSPEECKEIKKEYNKLQSIQGSDEIIAILSESNSNLLLQGTSDYSPCVFKIEIGESGYVPIFNNHQTTDLKKNSEIFYKFAITLISCFYKFHSLFGYFHGNINPESLIYKKGVTTGQIVVKLIELDSMFPNPNIHVKKEQINSNEKHFYPEYSIYNLKFRPPELISIIPGESFDLDEKVKKSQLDQMKNYQWSVDYKEESYAVGATLKEIVEINSKFIDADNPNIKKLNLAITKLMLEDPKSRSSFDQILKDLNSERVLVEVKI